MQLPGDPDQRMGVIRWEPERFVWSAPPEERSGRPLLVLLHGLGADEHDLAALTPYLPPRIVTVAVRAPLRYAQGYAWFDSRLDPADGADAAATGQLAALAWLRSLKGYSSLGVLGFSQGAAVTVNLLRITCHAVDYAVQLAGFLAAPLPDSDTAVGDPRTPVFSGHGEYDDAIPPARAAELTAWLRANTDLTERRYPIGHQISAELLDDVVAFLRVHAR